MDLIISSESHRINNISIYMLLPYFSAEMLQQHLSVIAGLTFKRLEDYLYAKLTDEPGRTFSPSKLQEVPTAFGFMKNGNIVKVRLHEKLSQRTESLKRED